MIMTPGHEYQNELLQIGFQKQLCARSFALVPISLVYAVKHYHLDS